MRSTLVWIAALSPSVLAAACNGDNCANAVKRSSAINTRDCKSFMTKTVTPCPSSTTTVTTTATVTKTIGSAPHNKREPVGFGERAVTSAACPTSTANSPPAYAGACSGAVRYSSACSCLGVTPGTTTIASPLATATSTVTSTSTVTAVCSTFQAKATSGTYSGQVLRDGVPQPYSDILALGFTTDVSVADTFVLIGNHIYGNKGNLTKPWRAFSGHTYVYQGPAMYEAASPTLNCTLAPIALNGTARITCLSRAADPGSVWQSCPSSTVLNIGPDVYDGGEAGESAACTGLDLVTIPKC